MALKFFRIPVEGSPGVEAELNAFLAGHKVLCVTRELVERETAGDVPAIVKTGDGFLSTWGCPSQC